MFFNPKGGLIMKNENVKRPSKLSIKRITLKHGNRINSTSSLHSKPLTAMRNSVVIAGGARMKHVNLQYAAKAYPEHYIGLTNIKKRRNGSITGVIECIGNKEEVTKRLKSVNGNVIIVMGNNLKQANRIGGQIFYE